MDETAEFRPRRHRSSTLSSLQDRTSDLTNTELKDSGRKPDEYYATNLSITRFQLRQWLLPLIINESKFLFQIQNSLRCTIFDIYFSWTANFGSHTFYVLMLPIPLWFGYCQFLRDLVFIIGWGIFITGVFKDYLCLPRPKSPPLHRITMSHYTAQEYGCPSSHSANATGVTLVVLVYLFKDAQNWSELMLPLCLAVVYYFSLIFGRIYCGMHGFTDIISGSTIGISVFLLRFLLHDIWDTFIFSKTNFMIPFIVIIIYYGSVYFHPTPLEECPCFEDSVLFMGVLLGFELSYYIMNFTKDQDLPVAVRGVIPYSFEQLGFIKSLLRLLTGIIMIFIWKSFSKKLLNIILSPFYYQIFSRQDNTNTECWVFKKRYSLDMFIRMMVYGGIAMIAVFAGVVFDILGLGCDFVITDYV